MKKLVLFIVSILFCISCDYSVDEPEKSPDSRFTGSWTYYYHYIASDGINEETTLKSYDFDDTNEVWYYTKTTSYTSTSGWYNYEYSNFFTWSVSGNTLTLNGLTPRQFEFKNGFLYIDNLKYEKD